MDDDHKKITIGEIPKKVIDFPGVTKLDLPAKRVLMNALESDLDGVILAGFDSEGDFYFASSYADGGDCLWLIEHLKMAILKTI